MTTVIKSATHFRVVSLAKWLRVRLRTKQLWVQIPLQSQNGKTYKNYVSIGNVFQTKWKKLV